VDDVVFGSENVKARSNEATRKQRNYVTNLLKAHPALGQPLAWDRQTISGWINRARALLDVPTGNPGVPTDTIYAHVPNLYHELLGTGNLLSELV